MSLTIKVFFKKENGSQEIRRFTVNTQQENLNETVRSKIQQLYPTISSGNFQLSWQDSDGDDIVFSCEEELKEAISCVQDGVLRIYITLPAPAPSAPPSQPSQPKPKEEQRQQQQQQQQHQREGPFHQGVTCDGCEGPVYGIRFKCCTCDDYDLCSSCEGKGLHTEHDMFRIEQPRVNPMNFLPPHLGRYIHRYMQGYNSGAQATSSAGSCGANASASAGASASASASSSTAGGPDPKPKGQNDEYLNNIGANIAAFLDPFGIDVTYDVHHGAEREQRHFRRGRGSCGPRGSRGSCGPRGFCGAWQKMGRNAQQADGEKKEETSMDTEDKEREKEGAAKDSGSQEVPMEESDSGQKAKEAPTEEWTFVPDDGTEVLLPRQVPIPMPAPPAPTAPSDTASDTAAQTPTPTLVPESEPKTATPAPPPATPAATSVVQGSGNVGTNMYPNLRIQQSLDQMLAMGFTNTGNWLSDLLTEHAGDIGATLDAIKVKATQQLESLRQ